MSTNHQHSNCLICGSEDLTPLKKFNSANLCKCGSCGFTFARRIPDEAELDDFYKSEYDVTRYFSPITVKRYEEFLDRCEVERKHNRILDIGAGYGFLLEIAKKRGWEVYGTEIIGPALDACRGKGIQMFEGTLADIDFGELQFDVIVSIEVIEHLNTPKPFVTKVHELLRPGGLFYITTPNFDSTLRYWLGEKYDVIGYPNHLCYYTAKTLKTLLETNGFVSEEIRTTGFSITRLKTSKGQSDQEYVSETSDDEMLRYKIEKSVTLRGMKTTANEMLNLLKIGDSLKGFFRKK